MFYVLIYNKGSSNTNISVNYKTNKHQTTDKADKQNEIISTPFFSAFSFLTETHQQLLLQL